MSTWRLLESAPGASAIAASATLSTAEAVRDQLSDGVSGLSTAEAASRLAMVGPNSPVTHRARLWPVLWRQLKSPLLALLLVAATVSFLMGERPDAVVIRAIVLLSVGLGCGNEYRVEKQAEACTTGFATARWW